MYDELTGRYTFSCPSRGEVRLPLSDFRLLDRLPGTGHPAVYRVTFACPCGEQHEGLVSHADLDWVPLAGSDTPFLNLMTARLETVAGELRDLAASQIRSGHWPWSFFCYPEEQARPVFPSSFRLLTPADKEDVSVAVRCPSCARTTVNLVSREHVDVPFFNDRQIRVVEHLFAGDRILTLEAFRAELHSGSFDTRRRDLAA
jgi:hypothetical protein